MLMVFFSSRISPLTSTVILRDRSPRATAVVTSAMLRTCAGEVRGHRVDESVRSFHVPATPGTTAWPPSLPSVPTSRATRVTSDANERSWSTIVLMASFSCRISPRTSTVIFFDRSPLATAMVTSAMLRTCAVRLPAIWLTDSVRSFHTPDTPLTCAWPPSLPSVPTSRATRVTSEVKTDSWSIIVLTSFAERRNSPSSGRPSTSSAIDWPRSPLATAPTARVTSVVGHTRSSISVLSAATSSAQPPTAPGTLMRCLSLPFLADHATDARGLRARRALTARIVVERVGDLAVDAGQVGRHMRGEVAVLEAQQCREKRARKRPLHVRGAIDQGRVEWGFGAGILRNFAHFLLPSKANPTRVVGMLPQNESWAPDPRCGVFAPGCSGSRPGSAPAHSPCNFAITGARREPRLSPDGFASRAGSAASREAGPQRQCYRGAMKVILFGATGMVGQGVLRECLLDDGVSQVIAVVRAKTGQSHEKLREIRAPRLRRLLVSHARG